MAKSGLRFNAITPPAGAIVNGADTLFEETALSIDQLRAPPMQDLLGNEPQ